MHATTSHSSSAVFITELDTFSYATAIHRQLCNNTAPISRSELSKEDEEELTSNSDLITLSEWCARYHATDVNAETARRVKAWYAAGRLDLEQICVLIERGRLSFKETLASLWPVYYEKQRKDGAPQYESFDVWYIEEMSTDFNVVFSRAAGLNAAAEHAIREKFAEFDTEWGIYRPLRPTPPAIPITGIPKQLQEYIKEVQKYGEVGQSMVTGLVLGILGAATSGTVRLEMTNGHTEPLNPAVLVLADSGGRKTSTMNVVKEPLVEIEKQLRKKDEHEFRQRKIKIENLDKEINARSKVSKADPAGTKKTVAELAEKAKELDELRYEKQVLEEENKTFRTIIANITPEELGRFLARSWSHSAAMISDDTNLFNQIKDVYGKTGDKQDIYLNAISGGSYENDRAGTGHYSFDFSSLSVTVMYQDDRFEKIMRQNPDLVYSGFIPRLCVIYAPKMAGYMTYKNYKMSPSIVENWRTIIGRIKNAAIDHIEAGIKAQHLENATKDHPEKSESIKYRTIKTSASGEAVFYDWVRAREPSRRAGEENSSISSWASKSNNRALVLAALFSLVDDPDARTVNDAYVQAGIDIENALTSHALYAAETSTETRAAQVKDILIRLADDLEEKHKDEPGFVYGLVPSNDFNKKIKNIYWAKNSTAEGGATAAAKEYLNLLQTYGHIRHIKQPSVKGAPKQFWMLRPEGL